MVKRFGKGKVVQIIKEYGWMIGALFFVVLFLYVKEKRRKKSYKFNIPTEKSYCYERKGLLTKTEYVFYLSLAEHFSDFVICPKVRLEDFIVVTDTKNRNRWRGYIKSRHVDFLICDNKLNILAGVELDDKSHSSAKAKKIDEFKNRIFQTIRVPLYRIKVSDKENYNIQLCQIKSEICSR